MSPKSKVILALDVSSSSTGYAIMKRGRWTDSKNSFGFVKTESSMTLGTRLVSFRNQIEEIIDSVNPTHIIIEDVFNGRNVKTMKLLARFNGVAVELSKRKLGNDPTVVLTSSVRSFLKCGRSKEEAFNYICDRYNLDWKFTKYNDITDAICLALYLHGTLE